MQLSRLCLTLLVGSGLAFQLVPAAAEVMLGSSASTFLEGGGRPDNEAINRGRAALRTRNLDQAEKHFSEAYRQNPASVEAMLGLAVVSHSQGKAKLARDWMASAVAMAPGQPAVLQAQARLLVEQGLPAAAEESYRAAIAANPEGLQLKLDLASLYTDTLRKPALAVSLLREALKQKPESVDILYQLALAYMADGRLDEAARPLEDALRRDPAEPRMLHARGLVAQRQGQAERALEYFDKALAVKKDFIGAMISRGDVLQLLGRTEAAVEAYRKAVSMAPGNALPHALMGQALNRLKRPAEAEKAYREALRLEPDNLRVANNLAVLLATQKTGLDDALSMIRRAIEREPNRATYLDTLGLVQQARGDKLAARQAFERAVALEPGDSEFRQHLAQLGNAAGPVTPPPAAAPASAPAPAPVAAQAGAMPPATRPAGATARPVVAEDPSAAVAGRLEAWRQAWESKDVRRYLSFYAASFVPADNRARSAWEADRRAKLDKKGEIRVQVGAPALKSEGEMVAVTFEQRYQSGSYSDAGRKRLEWVREAGEWKIRSERQL